MSKDPQFYILDGQAIQGQAGKPFSHEPGDKIKFPEQDTPVNNTCLCNYRYYQYYAFYQYLPQTGYSDSDIQFYFMQDTSDGQQPETDENGLFTFETYTGYNAYGWMIHSGPVYLGCHPAGTFQTGVWLPVGLPYRGGDLVGGITQPSTRYVYRKQFRQGSLKCMYVTTYKCCNGVIGCGIPVGDGSTALQSTTFPFFAADFYVTGIFSDSPQATLIKGTEICSCQAGTFPRKFERHSCDSATATGYYEFYLLPGQQTCADECQEAKEAARQNAIGYVRERLKDRPCVFWMLWKCAIPECQVSCMRLLTWQYISTKQQWSTVPGDVAGKGPGQLPPDAHTTQIIKKCDQHAIYQWTNVDLKTYRQAAAGDQETWFNFILQQGPQPLTENPCKDTCGYNSQLVNGGVVGDGSTSGSISGSGASDTPCNSPDPYTRAYLEYQFQQFDIYYLSLTKKNPEDIDFLNHPELDPCKDYYTAPTVQGLDGKKKLDWTEDVSNVKDYEILQRGRIRGVSFLNWNKGKTRFYFVVPSGQDPPQDQSDPRLPNLHELNGQFLLQDTNSNKCDGVYQCYYMGCDCPDPCDQSCSSQQKVAHIIGGCHKWNYIGRISSQGLLQRGICLGKWQASNELRTGGTSIGQAVYTVTSNQPDFCGQYPQPPEKIFQYVKLTVTPGCDEQQDDDIQSQLKLQSVPLCGQYPRAVFGWKKQDSLSSSDTIQFQQDYGYIDVSQESDTCQLYYFGPNYQGLELYDQNGQLDRDIQPPSFDAIFSNAKPSIIWNYPACIDYKKRYYYNVYTFEPDEADQNKTKQNGPEQRTIEQNITSNATPLWGWTNSDNPLAAEPLIQGGDGNVIPRTASMASDSYLCTVYFLQQTGYYQGGCDEEDEEGTVENGDDKEERQISPQTLLQLASPISWNRHVCLDYYTAFKYVYAQFQLNCQTSKLSPPGMQLPPYWQVSDPIQFPDINGAPQSPQTLHWGWLDKPNPLTGTPLHASSEQHIIPVTDPLAPDDAYLCTVYYVHKLAQYYGAAAQPQFGSDALPPDLDGYEIVWNARKCIPNASMLVAYYVAAFQPACSNPSGNIDPSQVTWQGPKTMSVSVGQVPSEQPTSGWYGTEEPTSQKIATSYGVVEPGDLCTVYYIEIIAAGYFCEAPPAGWPNKTATPPTLTNWSINWNRSKCLQQCNWYVYRQSIITQGCTGGEYKNIAETGEPIAKSQCDSNASSVQMPTGYFIKRNNEWIPAPSNNGTIVLGDSDACQVMCRTLVFSGKHCGEPQQSQLTPIIVADMQATQISWPAACDTRNTYIHYAYKTLQNTCQNPNPDGQWQYTSWVGIPGQGTNDMPVEGWHQGDNKTGAALVQVNGQTTPSGCQATYVHIISTYKACAAQEIQNSTPDNIPGITWASTCPPGASWYQNYAVYRYVQDCKKINPTTTSQCVVRCSTGQTQEVVAVTTSWVNSGTCNASRIEPIGVPYKACSSANEQCPIDSVGYQFPASCGGRWYQNWTIWTYVKKCDYNEITTSSQCYSVVVSAQTKQAVLTKYTQGWYNSGTCSAQYISRVGAAYQACQASQASACAPEPEGGHSFTSDCQPESWYQNYYEWTYSKDSNCSVHSSAKTGIRSATTSSGAADLDCVSDWCGSGTCLLTRRVTQGSPYSACGGNYGGFQATSTVTPPSNDLFGSNCCSIDCNDGFNYTVYGPEYSDDTTWSPSSISCNYGYKIYATTDDSRIHNSYGVNNHNAGFTFRWQDDAVSPAEIGFQIDLKNCEITLITPCDDSRTTVPLENEVTGTARTCLSPQAEDIHGIRTVTVTIHIVKCNQEN